MRAPAAFLLLACACTGSNNTSSTTPDAGRARLAPVVSACITDRSCTTPLVVAHRGEGNPAPENTVAAILLARDTGADVVEIDTRVTADGHVVLMHDDTLTRTTNQADVFPASPGVDQLSLADIRQLVVRDRDGTCTPQNADEDPDRCRVPTLEQALAAAEGRVILMLDFKTGDAAQVARIVREAGALERVLFFDANTANLDAAEAEAPGLVTMARATDVATTEAIINARMPFMVHVDPGYLADAAAVAHPRGVKVFVNAFIWVDVLVGAGELAGGQAALDAWADAEAAVHAALTDGADALQTDRPRDLADMIASWQR